MEKIGVSNTILRGRGRVHYVKDFPGPLSIKSVTSGAVAWRTGGRELIVNSDSFLVLQHGEPYSLDIESRTPVSTLCVFFQPGFVESVRASMASEEPDPQPASSPFLPRLHARDRRILPRMHAIASAQPDALLLDEHYLNLARDLLLLDRDLNRRLRLLPARRASTREELLRRVRRGQELLHADSSASWSLASLARESALSPYHFHRAFTSAFGQTPQQYRNALRLSNARRLLETTAMTVTEVCGAIGFESPPSFANLFRQSFGFPPTAVRKLSKPR